MSKQQQTTYEAARDRLEALERESAGIDEQLRAAALAGDDSALLAALKRRAALPALLDQARRALPALAVAHYDAALVALRDRQAEVTQRLDAATASVKEAEAARDAILREMHLLTAERQELTHERHLAWRKLPADQRQQQAAD